MFWHFGIGFIKHNSCTLSLPLPWFNGKWVLVDNMINFVGFQIYLIALKVKLHFEIFYFFHYFSNAIFWCNSLFLCVCAWQKCYIIYKKSKNASFFTFSVKKLFGWLQCHRGRLEAQKWISMEWIDR